MLVPVRVRPVSEPTAAKLVVDVALPVAWTLYRTEVDVSRTIRPRMMTLAAAVTVSAPVSKITVPAKYSLTCLVLVELTSDTA